VVERARTAGASVAAAAEGAYRNGAARESKAGSLDSASYHLSWDGVGAWEVGVKDMVPLLLRGCSAESGYGAAAGDACRTCWGFEEFGAESEEVVGRRPMPLGALACTFLSCSLFRGSPKCGGWKSGRKLFAAALELASGVVEVVLVLVVVSPAVVCDQPLQTKRKSKLQRRGRGNKQLHGGLV
jgi:hypothetical protein